MKIFKKNADNAHTKEGSKDADKKAGMHLDDDELEMIAGGDDYKGPLNEMVVSKDSHCFGISVLNHKWV